jgi:hypothetical protein
MPSIGTLSGFAPAGGGAGSGGSGFAKTGSGTYTSSGGGRGRLEEAGLALEHGARSRGGTEHDPAA